MTSQFAVSLVNFSYWYKFHANILTGPGVTTIFVYKVLTRNQEIGNTPVWVFPNIYRLRGVRNTKFDTNVSYKKLLGARVTAFTVSELSRENQLGSWGVGGKTIPPT